MAAALGTGSTAENLVVVAKGEQGYPVIVERR